MPLIDDPRYKQDAVATGINSGLMLTDQPEEFDASTLDVMAAAARQSTLAGASYERIMNRDPDMPDAPPNWDPLDHIQGYEEYARDLSHALTPSDLQGKINRIQGMQADRRVLARAGIGGMSAELGMSLLDPSFLVSAAVPEVALARFSRLATAVTRGAAGAAAYEAGLQGLQDGRSTKESLINIGGGALLSGVLGEILARTPKSATTKLRNAINEEVVRSEAGAAAVARPTTLAEESLARGAQTLSKVAADTPYLRRVLGTDLDIALNSESVNAHTALQDLADVPQMLEKNLKGVRTPDSVESAVVRHEARVADFIDTAAEQWAAYRARVPAGERMSKGDFYTSIASAARRGDSIGIKEVDEAAKFLRSHVFDPLKEQADKLNLFEKPLGGSQVPEPLNVSAEMAAGPAGVNEPISATLLTNKGIKVEARRAFKGKYDLFVEGDLVGSLQYTDTNLGGFRVTGVDIKPELRRKGIASAVYDFIENKVTKKPFERTGSQSADGAAFRKARDAGSANELKPSPVLGAESYFRRMYDREVIRANLAEWHQILSSHFQATSKADSAEITAAVEDVTRRILGADVGQSNFMTQVMVPSAGPLKERVLDIPDTVIEKFLVNDPVRVARAYVRDLAPQVELAKRFGDVDMKQQLQNITDEYNIKREKLRASEGEAKKVSEALERLTKQEKETKDAILRIRDRILGRAGRLAPDAGDAARSAVKASRGWRNLVAASKLGGTAVTGGAMDTAKIAAQYGFMPTIKKLTQLATSKEFRALSKTQARRAGSAVEAALSKRVQVAYDGAITEGWTQKLADGVYKYTGLNHITDFNRTLSATLLEDTVLKAAGKINEGKAIKAFERSRLASLGLGDDELKAIAGEIAQHGGEVDGIRVSGSADWSDKRLADIYDAAILKESKITVQQPGAADRVWWMDKETGKFIGQLKTFSLSSPTRLISGGLQMAGHGEYARAARFFGFMMMGGYLTHALRQAVAGKKPTTDPKTATFEAFTESGLGGVLPDMVSPLGRRLGLFGESVRYSDRNAFSAYGGPALGAVIDTYDLAFNRTQGGMSASDLHMLRRMLPYQNVWWLRREINALEGELAEGAGLKGADTASFGERMIRTDAVLPAKQRGGTGTGVIAQ